MKSEGKDIFRHFSGFYWKICSSTKMGREGILETGYLSLESKRKGRLGSVSEGICRMMAADGENTSPDSRRSIESFRRMYQRTQRN